MSDESELDDQAKELLERLGKGESHVQNNYG